MRHQLSFATLAVAALALLLPGCIFVRSTEHRITLNEHGGGEAIMRLKDIRSDAGIDSLVKRDFAKLMIALEHDGQMEFEQSGRTVVSKQITVVGDTLNADVTYRFPNLNAIDGLHVTDTEMYMVVPDRREIVRTNGTVAPWMRNETKISWPRSAGKLYFEIREKNLGMSTQLGHLYSKFVQKF